MEAAGAAETGLCREGDSQGANRGSLGSPPGLRAELGLPIHYKVPVEGDELQNVLNFLFGLS